MTHNLRAQQNVISIGQVKEPRSEGASGTAVDIATSLTGSAHPDELLIDETSFGMLPDDLQARFTRQGGHTISRGNRQGEDIAVYVIKQ